MKTQDQKQKPAIGLAVNGDIIMKMKLILENWKRYSLLSEGMRTPEELPDDVYVTIQEMAPDYFFYYSNNRAKKLLETEKIYGSIMISKTSLNMDGNCFNGMTVVNTTNTKSGWGPLLYDLAIEYASINSSGLMSDRLTVSDAAANVWEKYMTNRSDVQTIQMDNMKNDLTKPYDDNCVQSSAEEWARDKGKKWFESPLSKIYKKKNTNIMDKLKGLNKLIIKG